MAGAFRLYDSYHCSRYNTNTGVLTPEMFRSVFAKVRADLDLGSRAKRAARAHHHVGLTVGTSLRSLHHPTS